MKRIIVGLIAAGFTSSASFAADTGQITATLEVQGECEVLVTDIGAQTANFVGTDVVLAQSASLDAASFDNAPAALTVDAATTIAVMCSASDTNHTLNMTSGGASLADGTETISWSPLYALVSTPGTTNAIATTAGTDVALTANASDTSLHEYIVTANVTADNIAEAVPGTYTQVIDVTVSYGVPPAP